MAGHSTMITLVHLSGTQVINNKTYNCYESVYNCKSQTASQKLENARGSHQLLHGM